LPQSLFYGWWPIVIFRTIPVFFELMESTVKAPDLLIYLRSSIPNLVGFTNAVASMNPQFPLII
jgi:hypothetical protein